MIRFNYLLLLISWFCAAPIAFAQPVKKTSLNTFYVNAQIPTLKDSNIYIYYARQPDTVVRRLKVSPTGSFTFSAQITEPTKVFINMRGPGIDPLTGELGGDINFWVEPGKTTQLFTDGNTKTVAAKGNLSQTEQNDFYKINYAADMAKDNIKKMGSQAKKDGNFATIKPLLNKKWDSVETSKGNLIIQFIKQHPSSYVSLSLIKGYMFYFKSFSREDELASTFSLLSTNVKSSKAAISTKEFLGLNGNLRIGAKAVEITSRDSSGNQISLSSLAGQYVLVDFWASWCVPCRGEIPALKTIHEKFAGHNFTILSVSLDDNRNKWLNALKQESMPWKNVSDLEGFNAPSARTYNIHSIPFNVLVDPAGKIIAKNLNSTKLLNKLNEVIK